jgi:predicted  nucleic acid-binding Zn-ribbon protein
LKFSDSKDNEPLKLGSDLVIAYLIYQLFKNQNVEGWPSGTDAKPSFPTCGDGDLLYIGSPSPSPGPDDNIMRSIGNSDFLSEDPIIYVGKTCLEMPWTNDATAALHADWVSNRIDRDNIKTIAFVKKTNRLMDPTSNGLDLTNEAMIFCSSSPNDTCVPDAAVTDADADGSGGVAPADADSSVGVAPDDADTSGPTPCNTEESLTDYCTMDSNPCQWVGDRKCVNCKVQGETCQAGIYCISSQAPGIINDPRVQSYIFNTLTQEIEETPTQCQNDEAGSAASPWRPAMAAYQYEVSSPDIVGSMEDYALHINASPVTVSRVGRGASGYSIVDLPVGGVPGELLAQQGASDTHATDAATGPAATDSIPLYQHCMAGDDNLINTNDLLDCFSSGSRCGHENCALYHSLHLDHIVTDDVHSSPNDHCSHLLYYGGSPNPTMDHGSVIQQIVLKYANHYDQSINTPEEFETAVMSNEILLGAGNSNVFTDSEEDQELCAKFNALYDSDCLRGSPDNSHSQLFENIHTACSSPNISPPSPDFNLQDDWLNNMDRYCSIGSSSQTKYNGVPIEQLKHSTYTGYLYATSKNAIQTSQNEALTGINIGSPQSCGPGYQGNYTLLCNNSIDRLVNSLEVSNSCSPSPTSVTVAPALASASDIDGLLYQLENLNQEITALSQSITVDEDNSASPGDLTRLRESLEAEIAEIQGTGTIPANIQVELTNLRGELDNLSTAARPEDIRRIKGEIEMLHSEDSRDISNLGKRISKLNRELTSISAASPGDLSSLQTSLETDMGNIQSQINTLQSSPNISSEEFEALRQELTDSLTRLRQTESDMSNLQAINQAPVPPPAQEEESMFNKYWPFILFVGVVVLIVVLVLSAKSGSKTTADNTIGQTPAPATAKAPATAPAKAPAKGTSDSTSDSTSTSKKVEAIPK